MGALIHGNRSIIIDSGMGRHMSNIMLVPCKNMANRISRCFLNVEYGDWLDESSIRLNVSGIENIKIQEINGYDDPSKYYIAVFAKNQQNTVPFSIGKTFELSSTHWQTAGRRAMALFSGKK